MTLAKNKVLLIGIVALICVGLLIVGVFFPIWTKEETGPEQEKVTVNGTPLTTYDNNVVEPGSNKVAGLTNEDWFSELIEDDKLAFYSENLGESEFNSTDNDDRNAAGGYSADTEKDASAEWDDGKEESQTSVPPSEQIPRDIEEADIIKLVDDTLYILNTYRGFMLIDVSDPDEPYIVSRVPLFGYPVEMYVVEPKAYVILTHYYNTFLWAEDSAVEPAYRHGSEIVVIDIADQAAPKVEQYIEMDGFITDSRRVGQVIYAVANDYDYYGYDSEDGIRVDAGDGVGVETVVKDSAGTRNRAMDIVVEEEAKEESSESVEAPPEEEPEVREEDTDADGLPDDWEKEYFGDLDSNENNDNDGDGYTNIEEYKYGTDPTNKNSTPYIDPDDESNGNDDDELISKEEEETEETETEGTVVVSINFEDLTHVVEVDREWFPGSSNLIHVTEEAIFVAQQKYEYYRDEAGYQNRYYTKITYVDISDYHGQIKVRDTFEAEGYLEDRYQMDSFEKTFRLVTHFWGDWRELGVSKLWVFDTSNPDEITKKGELKIDDAGSLMATRFAGDRAYTIHLPYSTDPLDVIDLSDPSKPVLTDVLEMPGWVTHMEVRGYKIIALGVDDSDDTQKVAVSLFDVSDPYNAVLEARVKIGDGYSWSAANWDPKALTVVDDQNLVLVPFESYSYDELGKSQSFSGLQLVKFDLQEGALTAGGAIEQMGSVQRTRANSERIFAISYQQLQVIDASDLNKPKITATLELCNNIIDVLPMGDYCVQVISEYDYSTGKSVTKLRTVDSSMPDTSNFLAEKAVDYYIEKIYTNGNFIYLVCSKYSYDKNDYQAKGFVLVYDYTDPVKPEKSSEFEIKDYQGNYYGYYGWYYYDWYYWYQPRGSVLEYSFALVDSDLLVYHPEPVQYYSPYYVYDYEDDVVYDETDSEPKPDDREYNETSENKTEPEPTVEKKVPVYYNWNTYNETLYFIDLSDPVNPKKASEVTMVNTSRISGMQAKNQALYVVQYKDTSYYDDSYNWHYQAKYFLTRLDLTKPSEPVAGDSINIPGSFLGISDDEKIIFTQTSQYDSSYNWKQTLNVLELKDGKAVLTTALDLGDDYPSIMIQDTTILLTYNVYNYYDSYYYDDVYYGVKTLESESLEPKESEIKTKVQIIDASNPSALKLKATIGLRNYANLYNYENDKLYLQLSGASGLLIYDLSELNSPSFLGYFPTYGYVNSIREDLKTSRIYLACGYYGVLLIEVE